MILPLQLRQKDVTLPPAMADEVRERAQRLERHVERITRCRVTIEGSGKHHRQGRYSVQIDLCVPGAEIVIRTAPCPVYVRRMAGAPGIKKTAR